MPISKVDCIKVEKRDSNAEVKTNTITLSVYSRVIYERCLMPRVLYRILRALASLDFP